MNGGTTLAEAATSPAWWMMSGLTLFTVLAAVVIHYRVLTGLNRHCARLSDRHPRLLYIIGGILMAHVVEIWLFGLAVWLGTHTGLGGLEGLPGPPLLLDCIYYSAVVFSTLGFGDLIPTGPLQLLAGTEGLTGLVLITWSASFTFLEMQRWWLVNARNDADGGSHPPRPLRKEDLL